MSTGLIIGICAAVFVFVLILCFIGMYNGLVRVKNRADNGWAQIDTQLQRRYDLIPNLVETVKGYAKHESQVFEEVTKARAGMASAQSVSDKANADNILSGTLKSLFAVAEAYPDLKANQNFKELQLELTNTENKISFARQFYNDTVLAFNTAILLFPKNIVASMLKFTKMDYFKVDGEEVKTAPKVSF